MNTSEKLPSILFVDDEEETLLSLVRAVKTVGLSTNVHAATSIEKANQILNTEDPLVAVIDLCLEKGTGVESGFSLLRTIRTTRPGCRTIVLTGHGSNEHGIRALKEGAASFLVKPADIEHLTALINDGITQAQLLRSYQKTVSEQSSEILADTIIGVGAAASKIREEMLFFAHTQQPLLITGGTGTGKGLCALSVHRCSALRENKFVRYQPSFTAGDLISSELFGHVKGAFTGAEQDRDGLVSQAEGGTLFLDEIDELPAETQVMLLGLLQDKRYRKVGSDRELTANFRLICATNQDPEEAIANGKLREDLYHRIAHQEITLPPLTERREDVVPIGLALLSRLNEDGIDVYDISDAAKKALSQHPWPGNVRQLEGVVTGAAYRASYARRNIIEVEDLQLKSSAAVTPQEAGFHELVENYKHQLVSQALERNQNNQVRAAADLGVDRSTLRRYLLR